MHLQTYLLYYMLVVREAIEDEEKRGASERGASERHSSSSLNAFVVSIDTTRRRPLIFGTFEKQDRGEEALLLSSSSSSSSSSSRDTNTRS